MKRIYNADCELLLMPKMPSVHNIDLVVKSQSN